MSQSQEDKEGGAPCSGSQAGVSKRHGHECSALSLGAEPLSDLVGVLAPGQVHPGKSLAFGRWSGMMLLGTFPVPAGTAPGSFRERLCALYVQ